jgi:hypothetical protein
MIKLEFRESAGTGPVTATPSIRRAFNEHGEWSAVVELRRQSRDYQPRQGAAVPPHHRWMAAGRPGTIGTAAACP